MSDTEEAKQTIGFKSELAMNFVDHVDEHKIARERFCSNMHPFLTLLELKQRFEGIGFPSDVD